MEMKEKYEEELKEFGVTVRCLIKKDIIVLASTEQEAEEKAIKMLEEQLHEGNLNKDARGIQQRLLEIESINACDLEDAAMQHAELALENQMLEADHITDYYGDDIY